MRILGASFFNLLNKSIRWEEKLQTNIPNQVTNLNFQYFSGISTSGTPIANLPAVYTDRFKSYILGVWSQAKVSYERPSVVALLNQELIKKRGYHLRRIL